MHFKVWRRPSVAERRPPPCPPEQPMMGLPPLDTASTTPPGSPQAAPVARGASPHVQKPSRSSSLPLKATAAPTKVLGKESSAAELRRRWAKVSTSPSKGPWSTRRSALPAFKAPLILGVLDTDAHNPRSPFAWFLDQLGIPLLKIIPRRTSPQFTSHCEYELGNLNISPSNPSPSGYREPFTSSRDFPNASWRKIPMFTTPVPRDHLRMSRGYEYLSTHVPTERITIAFKVCFLATNKEDQYVRTSYEESWIYFAVDKPTMGDFYEQYGQVLHRTTEQHRNRQEYFMGPWKVEGRGAETMMARTYEEAKKFLRVDDDAELMYSKEAKALEVTDTEGDIELEDTEREVELEHIEADVEEVELEHIEADVEEVELEHTEAEVELEDTQPEFELEDTQPEVELEHVEMDSLSSANWRESSRTLA